MLPRLHLTRCPRWAKGRGLKEPQVTDPKRTCFSTVLRQFVDAKGKDERKSDPQHDRNPILPLLEWDLSLPFTFHFFRLSLGSGHIDFPSVGQVPSQFVQPLGISLPLLVPVLAPRPFCISCGDIQAEWAQPHHAILGAGSIWNARIWSIWNALNLVSLDSPLGFHDFYGFEGFYDFYGFCDFHDFDGSHGLKGFHGFYF